MPSLEDIYATREVEMKEAFDMFDKDGSGKISFKEFKYSLMEMGRNLTDVEFDALMNKYDSNHDGFINFEGNLFSLILMRQYIIISQYL